jgi:hypothetical protein
MLIRLLKDLFGGAAARSRLVAPAGQDPNALYALALAAYQAGDRARAMEHCEHLRRVAPEMHAADMLQSQVRFEGENYFQVMLRIHEALKPRTYLEIGVSTGDSLRLVQTPTQAIGVDPEPQLAAPLAPHQRVFKETSDAFFAGHDVRAEFGGLPVDLAFIDGMHHFEFALRDFANTERLCAPQSTILIHDTYPLDRVTAERDRHRVFWSGDVWRLVVLLKKYRPGLVVQTIATAPTGLTVVRNLDPGSRLILDRHDELCREFLAIDYSFIERDMPAKLNLFPNDWAKVRALLK